MIRDVPAGCSPFFITSSKVDSYDIKGTSLGKSLFLLLLLWHEMFGLRTTVLVNSGPSREMKAGLQDDNVASVLLA